MQPDKITAEEISDWLAAENKKAAWLAKTMGVTAASVSRWLSGKVIPSGSDEAILKMLVRGEMPFTLIGTRHLHGVLDFTTDQWRVIETLARRNSMTPGQWIADQIRSYIAYNEEAKAEAEKIVNVRKAENAARLEALPDLKVAEDSPDIKAGGN